jgi:photosystem II stability/assembly factor-like uncharacterized protein
LVSPSRPALAALSGGVTLLRTGSGVVWASADDDIFRSTDGGAHWKAVLPAAANPATCGCFYHSYFFGPERAWDEQSLSVGNSFGARLWSTVDGGRSWQVGTLLPVPPLWQLIEPDLQGVGYTLDFTSPSNGYLVVSTADLSGAPELLTGLWHTRDGGRIWTEVGGTHVPLNGLEVSASSVCDAVGYLAVTFANPETGWVANPCGQGPPMWETHDGGATWRPMRLATPPGGWGRGVVPMPAQPVLTSSGVVIDQVTTGVGALVVEEINADGSWRYLGRLRTEGISLPAALDVIDDTHFALPASDGMWVTNDAAKTWRFVASGIDLADLGPMQLFLDSSQPFAGIVLAESDDSGTDADPTAVALRTTDGGHSWQPVGSTLALDPYVGEPRYDLLAFSGPRVGYVAGNGGLSVTDDGGRTWHSALGMSEPIQQLDVEGTGDAVVLSSDSLLTTSDGGSHWRLASEPTAGALYSVSFVGAGVGYGVVCESSEPSLQDNVVALVRTTDDGKSWRAVSVPPDFACTALSNGQGTPPSELCVASPEVLYAIAGPLVDRPGMMPQPTVLFRSLDGGRSWSRVAAASDDGIVSCDGDTLWTVAEESFRSNSAYAIRYSSDGGRHFRSLIGATSGTSTYADIGLQGVRIGRAAGLLGSIETPTMSSAVLFEWTSLTNGHTRTILQTTSDTGRSWAPPRAVPSADFALTAFFRSTRSGFILSQSYSASSITSLVATNDGGRSWQTVAEFPQLP